MIVKCRSTPNECEVEVGEHGLMLLDRYWGEVIWGLKLVDVGEALR